MRTPNVARSMTHVRCLIKCLRRHFQLELHHFRIDQVGFVDEALQSFGSMPEPDQCSWNSMVSGFVQHCRFDNLLRAEWSCQGRSASVCGDDGYAKAASVKVARTLFTKMMEKNVVSWNGENEEALGIFLLLKRESAWRTHYTFTNLLNACANRVDLLLGRQAGSFTHIEAWFSVPAIKITIIRSGLDATACVTDGSTVFNKPPSSTTDISACTYV
ncbi:hypothetical protein ACLB2K_068422 [Fragaria x ananassa]